MPWDLIRVLIIETYGGKIDDDRDFKLLGQLVDRFLRPEAYEDEFKLAGKEGSQDGASLAVPNGTSMNGFMQWVDSLPEREPPTYLGLPANAEKLLLVGQGKQMIADLAKVREILDEGEQLMSEAEASG